MMINLINDFYDSLDWDSMTIEEKVVHETEKMIAYGRDRATTLVLFGAMVGNIKKSGMSDCATLSADSIRPYEDIIQDIVRSMTEVPEPLQDMYESINEQLELNATETTDVEEEPDLVPEVEEETLNDLLGLTGLDVTFDETNGEEVNTNVVINRRGTGTPVRNTDTPETSPLVFFDNDDLDEDSGSDNDVVANPFELLQGTSTQVQQNVVLGKDVEDEDIDFIHGNITMLSYFSLFPVNATRPVPRNPDGTVPVDFAVSILYSTEMQDEEDATETIVEDDVVIAPTMEHAIAMIQDEGYIYNKNKNIFSKGLDGERRAYARILMDVDLRGVLG